MEMHTDDMERYILNHIDVEPEVLKKLVRKTNLYTLKPRMMSGHLQGRMLKMFASMMNAKKVVEIGTFTGYSALCLAEGVGEGGVVHTIDINDELEEFVDSVMQSAGEVGKRVITHIGDAVEVIPTLGETFDLCFLDGNKRHYTQYLEAVYPVMRVGGVIIADNTLWDGHVLENNSKDAQTLGIITFNDLVAKDDRFEKVIVPVRDGMTLIRKIK